MSKFIKKVKDNWRYFKMGVKAERERYAKLQNIKGKGSDYRTKAEQAWADIMNKTKRRKKK